MGKKGYICSTVLCLWSMLVSFPVFGAFLSVFESVLCCRRALCCLVDESIMYLVGTARAQCFSWGE